MYSRLYFIKMANLHPNTLSEKNNIFGLYNIVRENCMPYMYSY